MKRFRGLVSILLVVAMMFSVFSIGCFSTSAASISVTSKDAPSNTTYVQTSNSSYAKITFDRSVVGAIGWTICSGKVLHKTAALTSAAVESGYTVGKGQNFTILDWSLEKSTNIVWWKIAYGARCGWYNSSYCMINLPDIITSISYDITNAYSSIFKTGVYYSNGTKTGSATSIKGVTGLALSDYNYNTTKMFNGRTLTNTYVCPVLFHTAYMLQKAQDKAESQGYSLKIYEAYRPKSTSNLIYNSYTWNTKYGYDKSGSYWKKTWFLAEGTSDHNVGAAVDITLIKSDGSSVSMPTQMHMLTAAAVKYKYGTDNYKSYTTELLSSSYASSMTSGAKTLDKIMKSVGFSSLASEWWHFSDRTAYSSSQTFYSRSLNEAGTNGCSFTPIYMGNTVNLGKDMSGSNNDTYQLTTANVKSYTVYNSSVVSVSSSGKMTAKGRGKTAVLITKTDGSYKVYSVNVGPMSTTLKLDKSTLTLKVGKTYDFNSYIASNTVAYNRTYSSSNTSVATITSGGGIVTAKKAGTTTITCKLSNGTKATCKLTVTS